MISFKVTQSALRPRWPRQWLSHFEKSSPQPEIKVLLEIHFLLDFQSSTEKPFLSVLLIVHHILFFLYLVKNSIYHVSVICKLTMIWYLTSWNQIGGGWKTVRCHGNSRRCRFCRTISLPRLNGLCCKLVKIALFISLIQNWLECMMSSVILFAYFRDLSNLNISRSDADIYKQ